MIGRSDVAQSTPTSPSPILRAGVRGLVAICGLATIVWVLVTAGPASTGSLSGQPVLDLASDAPSLTMSIVRLIGSLTAARLAIEILREFAQSFRRSDRSGTALSDRKRSSQLAAAILGLSTVVSGPLAGAQDGTATLTPLDGPPSVASEPLSEATATASTTVRTATTASPPATGTPTTGTPTTTTPTTTAEPSPPSAVPTDDSAMANNSTESEAGDSAQRPTTDSQCGAESWVATPAQQWYDAATRHLANLLGREPTDSEADAYFRSCVELNKSVLDDPDAPEIVAPGEVLAFPPLDGGRAASEITLIPETL